MLATILFEGVTVAQAESPSVRVEVVSALVWGEDFRSGAVSSSIVDPLNGNTIHKLSHAGVEVSSQMGFERIGAGRVGELLNFTSTIVNTTGTEVVVHDAGASVDGLTTQAISVVPTLKGFNKREREHVWVLGTMHCFLDGFLSHDNFFSPNIPSTVFRVAPNTSLRVSFITKDPRNYPIRCSMEGCLPTGTMRFYVTVNTQNYIFPWPGQSAVYCGK
jgi:hypothetical protein